MIVREKKHIIQMLFTWKGSVLKKIYPTLIAIFSFSWLVYYFHYRFTDVIIPLNIGAFALVGISLAVFLGFCNTAAYDRFWEGRKQWGNLVIQTRSLTYQIQHFIKEDQSFSKEDKKEAVNLIIAFCYAFNYQLREKEDHTKLQNYLSKDIYQVMMTKRFKPSYLLSVLTDWLSQQYKEGRIDSMVLVGMNEKINEISGVLAACERIVHTKIPFTYSIILHRTVYIYCFILPFGLIDVIVWTMPFFVTFVAYTYIALDAVVSEIAEPFGEEDNDLALDQICANIEYALAEISQLPLPEIIVPDDNYHVS